MTRDTRIAVLYGIPGAVALAAMFSLAVLASIRVCSGSKPTDRDGPRVSSMPARHESTGPEPSFTPSRHVFIDARDPAYAVYYTFSAGQFGAMRRRAAAQKRAEIVTWEAFCDSAGRHIAAHVKRFDYKSEPRLAAEVVELLETAGGPIGVTWNGGIAVTYTDYADARRALEAVQ